ncbi:hypothetical protein ACFUNF_05960 [Streptomyces sp. NPDC057291]|uniref:hypothetical protein n=1 Tax=Streptomyces sp. NPDC057291 TaxID=3346087 RepID=UPI00362D1041
MIISAAISAFFYFDTDLKAAFATFAGLLGITIALQVEAILQGRRAAETATRQQRLTVNIESIAWLPEVLDESLEAINKIENEFGGTMAVNLAKKAFGDCLGQLRDLQRGKFYAPFVDHSLAFTLTEQTHNALLATSVEEVDLFWWQSATGQTYWRLHEDVLRRGVQVQRIFIYRTWTDDHATLARRQHAGGVRTLRVNRDDLPPDLRVDMIMWDGLCGYESSVNSSGEAITNNYTFAKQDLTRMLDRYRMIESCAEQWPRTVRNEDTSDHDSPPLPG